HAVPSTSHRLIPDSEILHPLTPLESALTDEYRAGFQGLYLQTLTGQRPEIGRSCLSLSPLESALTDTPSHNQLYSQHIQKMRGGVGGIMLSSPGAPIPDRRRSETAGDELFRVRRLVQVGDFGDRFGAERLHVELFGEEGEAVAASFGVECVG